jgi:membrane protein
MIWKDVWGLGKDAAQEWVKDKVPRLGAALAFYTVLSLAPLLIIVIAIVGLVFGEQAAQGQLVAQIHDLVGKDGATAIEVMVANARKPTAGIISSVLSVTMLLLGATGVFSELQDSLNTIWEVEPKPGRGVWGVVRNRFLTFALVLAIGFLLLVSLVLSAALQMLGDFVSGLLSDYVSFLQATNFLLSLVVFTLLFATIFKLLPDVRIGWKDVWLGAAVTAVLFVLGKSLIGLYLGRSSIGSTYGAAGSLVVLLVWVYYSAQILYFGAEFTKVYAARFGTRIQPARDARPVTEEARAHQGLPRNRKAATR